MTATVAPHTCIPLFDEATHSYFHPETKQRLDGVGEILRGVGIVDMEHASKQALSRGRAIHMVAHIMHVERLTFDEFLARYDLHPDLHGYCRGWESCLRETGMVIIDSEQRRYHERLRFAGTRDIRCWWKGRRYKLDLKSIGTPGAAGPDWARYQLAAYELLDPAPKGEQEDGRAAIWLYPNGRWNPEVYHDFGDAAGFLSILSTFRIMRNLRRLRHEPN